MSSGLLPPVPDLIPISALRKSSSSSRSNSSGGSDKLQRDCAPCESEVMGEQRSRRRTQNQPAIDLINSAGSRGSSAAPQTPQTRKARSERHRKSDRQRKTARTRSISKHGSSKSREKRALNASSPEAERPANPRVNPIFVWVRQEDNRIVDVKCEDYDKRNRILLTKTAQGWRAIPRTETLVPTLKESVDHQHQTSQGEHHQHHHHHRHHRHKSRKSKTRQKSAGSQFPEADHPDSDVGHEHDEAEQESEESDIMQRTSSTSWMCDGNVNVESLLPSHTIHVTKRPVSPVQKDSASHRDIANVNSAGNDCAQTQPIKCSADRMCDVSPLDNLLAVAELEFKQQIQSGEWNKTSSPECIILGDDEDANDVTYGSISSNIDEVEMNHSHLMKNMEQLSDLIESQEHEINKVDDSNEVEGNVKSVKSEECDYNEDDDIAMNDILSRLEQSLQSPDCTENVNIKNEEKELDIAKEVVSPKIEMTETEESEYANELSHSDAETTNSNNNNNINCQNVPETENNYAECDTKFKTAPEEVVSPDVQVIEDESEKPEIIDLIESSTNDEEPDQDQPTDLSIKNKIITPQENSCDALDCPTDLSIRKLETSPNAELRPPSQNSEAIQSPQPSGIPAVPQSPDLVSTSSNINRSRTIFLESLLATTTQKISLNSEVTISRQKEPLDLGKCRKSASPTVTCSEEIVSKPSNLDAEPPTKKFKSADITLKTLLDPEEVKLETEARRMKEAPLETPRLLELLQNESKASDPLLQFKQLLSEIDIPEPLMVPKSSFADLLKNPRREIIKIISEQPHKNIPINEILVVYKDKLISALQANSIKSSGDNNIMSNSINSASHTQAAKINERNHIERLPQLNIPTGLLNKNNKRPAESPVKQNGGSLTSEPQKNISATDIEAATEAAFNQMMWLPYANHLDALNYANNQDVLQALYSTLPLIPNQIGELHPSLQQMMFGNMMSNKIPPMSPVNIPPFPPVNFTNPLEFGMWQEAVMQANLLRNKNPFENLMANQSLREMHKSHVNSKKQSHLMTNNQRSQQSKTVQQSLHQQNLEQQQRLQQERLQQSLFSPNISNGHHQGYQNPYLNVGAYNNNEKSKQSLHISPQFNQIQHQKIQQQKHQNTSGYAQKQKDYNANFFAQFSEQEKHMHQQYMHSLNQQKQLQMQHAQQQQKHAQQDPQQTKHNSHKSNASTKSFGTNSNSSYGSHYSMAKSNNNNNVDNSSSTTGDVFKPIDLSGSTPDYNKSKVKSSGIDPQPHHQQQQRATKQSCVSLSKNYEDLPEVGSTTASIEEMQAAHKQFWHPLFGNVRDSGVNQEDWDSLYAHQGYSPWNSSSVMATGD